MNEPPSTLAAEAGFAIIHESQQQTVSSKIAIKSSDELYKAVHAKVAILLILFVEVWVDRGLAGYEKPRGEFVPTPKPGLYLTDFSSTYRSPAYLYFARNHSPSC